MLSPRKMRKQKVSKFIPKEQWNEDKKIILQYMTAAYQLIVTQDKELLELQNRVKELEVSHGIKQVDKIPAMKSEEQLKNEMENFKAGMKVDNEPPRDSATLTEGKQ